MPSSSAWRRNPGSSVEPSISTILNRLPLVSSAKSRRLTLTPGDISVMRIASFVVAVVPAFRAFTGFRTNGSSLVPAPETKFGREVVCSGSGPTRTTFSRFLKKRRSKRRRSKSNKQHHHGNKPPSSSSSEDLESIHSPLSSTVATSLTSLGLLPHLTSSSSRTPSPSSSSSISRPVADGPSGRPSLSVSASTAIVKLKWTPVWLLLANTVYSVIGDVSVGTPEMIPDSPDRDMLPLNSIPAGRAGKIDHVPGSIPLKFGTITKSG